MGKTPTPKRHGARPKPFVDAKRGEMSAPVDADDGLASAASLHELKDEIMTNLQSAKPAERECGARLFANLLQANKKAFQDEDMMKNDALLKKSHVGDLTRTLAPLLLDRVTSVRLATADALR